MLNPVFFYEGIKHVPKGSIVLELGAHTLLQGLLIESIDNITHIGFMKRDSNNIHSLFDGISHCYVAGLDLDCQNIVKKKL